VRVEQPQNALVHSRVNGCRAGLVAYQGGEALWAGVGGGPNARSFTAHLRSDQGRPTCQQVVSSNPARRLASHHGTLCRDLIEQR
jgi:hypothetical protein